ncbi:hypothetical protein CERSUDRAFT_49882, partial [Gelatoporia subvermispora B]
IGGPVTFSFGPLTGYTIRGELEELQKAEFGRKFTQKDRRPLDPPPVARLRLFQVVDLGTPREYEVEFEHYEYADTVTLNSSITSHPTPSQVSQLRTSTLPPMALRPLLPRPSAEARQTSPLAVRLPRLSHNLHHPDAESVGRTTPSDVVAYLNDYAITERSVCTRWLAGNICVDASVIDYEGRQMLIFVFSDVAVQLEGTFILRYRAFNVHARTAGERNIPVFAQRYGGPFEVYSTKTFPGLRASTALTKHLSSLKMRVHIRSKSRKRRATGKRVGKSEDVDAGNHCSKIDDSLTASVTSRSLGIAAASRCSDKGKGKGRERASDSPVVGPIALKTDVY